MFGMIKKLFGDSWDNDLLEEISRRKFLAYTQIAAKDKVFKETPALFNQYVIDLEKAFKQFIKHIKMTYGDPNFFKDKYESKNMELLDELFIIGEKCIEEYTKSKFKINTEWDTETHKTFFEPVKEEMNDLLKENYLNLSEAIRLLLATGIADCFHKKLHNRFPNYVLFMENFFIDGIDPHIQEYINNTKSNCMNEVLDIYEDNLLKTKEKDESQEQLKQKSKKEILEELKEANNSKNVTNNKI